MRIVLLALLSSVSFTSLSFAQDFGVGEAKGELETTLKDLTEAIRLDPQRAANFSARGRIWARKGEYDKALKDFTEAIRLDPQDAIATNARGCMSLTKGELGDALKDFTEAIRLDPKLALAFNNRGATRQLQRQFANALKDFSEAVRLDPKNASALRNRAWLLATAVDEGIRNGGGALQDATQLCKLRDWKFADDLSVLAAAYAETGNFAKAIEHEERASALFATDDDRQNSLHRLALYRDQKPFRDVSPAQAAAGAKPPGR